ncbi:MAG TPA: universal stress protein [Solirubrobacterales bacterium]|nr:universal stress protein [Solirubrobacterales bacterium]
MVDPTGMTVVVGYDARDEARDALHLARAVSAATGAELRVAVVLPRAHIPIEWAVAGRWLADELSDELFEAAEHELEGMAFERVALDGGLGGRSAARALYEYARDERADLIVVGSSHRGVIGRVVPGSVGESLLSSAPCAVAIAPRGFADAEPGTKGVIGVGVDRGHESELALREAVRLAQLYDVRLRVLTVVPEVAELTIQAPRIEQIDAALQKDFRQVLEDAVASVPEGVETEPILLKGDAAGALVEQSGELDLIVLGSRGYGPLRAALAGAVSSRVLRAAACPVLIVPRASEERGG